MKLKRTILSKPNTKQLFKAFIFIFHVCFCLILDRSPGQTEPVTGHPEGGEGLHGRRGGPHPLVC